MEFRFRRYDGEYRWLQSSGVPRFNANGSFLGYIGSATDITEHKLAEQSLSKVGQASILAQEEERANVAQELHRHIDGLISVSIDLDRCEQNALGSVVDIRREIREIRKEVNEIVNGILDLWHRLHTWKLEYLGLAKAAESFCRELADTQKVKIDFHCEGVPKELPKEIALCLYRVLQESLQNATKYSTSPRYEVLLNGKWNEIQLTVRDWGCGFELAVAMNGPGLGLVYMKEMLKVVGGELVVDSQPQRGTRVQSRVPLKQTGEDVRPLPIQ
jgi:signal transduction histidine kinase